MRSAAKRFLLSSFSVCGLALASPSLLADGAASIAVVDTQRVVMDSEDGVRMRATLKRVFDERQLELDKKQNDLQKEREALEKQRGVLSQEALAQRAEKWQIEVNQVQQSFVAYNQELQKKQNELMQPIYEQALAIVQRVAAERGFMMVIDKQAVPYVRADLDLTEQVIIAHNNRASAGAAPAPAPAAKK